MSFIWHVLKKGLCSTVTESVIPDLHLADRLLQLLKIILAGADLGEVVYQAELDT